MRWRSKTYVLVLTSLGMLLVLNAYATGSLFECVDAHGRTVFTDSPRQLLACRALDFSSHDTSSGGSMPASGSSTSNAGVDAARTPTVSASRSPFTTAIPVERLGQVLVVSATLNGATPARLIVDTGASQTIISHRLALDLGIFSTAHTTPVVLHTASGVVQADAALLDSIQLGGTEVRNSHIVIHDLPDLPFAVDGLLGLSVLGAYQTTLDPSRGELRLVPSSDKSIGLAGKK